MSRALVWFRRDLTLTDNPAWATATTEHDEVAAVYVLEPGLRASGSEFRQRFHLACLASLADELRAAGGDLTVVTGDARAEIPRLAREHGAHSVSWNDDVTGRAQRRDGAVADALAASGVGVDRHWGTLVAAPGSVLTAAGAVPRVFTRFYEKWAELPDEGEVVAGGARVLALPGEPLPAPDAEPPIPAGAAAARARLAAFGARADAYPDERDRPDLDGTSHLSADLRFGTISPRAVARTIGRTTKGRAAVVRQLAWRDWYAHLFSERPDLVDRCQQPAYEQIEWRDDPEGLAAWQEGRTGYPIVDAGMRELATTGWMHNRVRMIVASFLVKDLLIDWRHGERHFRRLLIDGDVAQNAGNWQWCAGTGPDAAPYFRIFNPITQSKKFDPDGVYLRRFVPELAAVPDRWIHAPWEAPPLDLAGAGVVLGDTYPAPIVDHSVARERTLAAYSAARAAAEAEGRD